MDAQQLRAALVGMLQMPHGGRRHDVAEQTRLRGNAHAALVASLNDAERKSVLDKANARAKYFNREIPRDLDEAIYQYGFCIVLESIAGV